MCVPWKPCQAYTDKVNLRIIIVTFNRAQSLLKLLKTLQNLELDGDRGAVEIWIDVTKNGSFHADTVRVARSFRWRHGVTRVHIQSSHAGIIGQWINSWRPRPESPEIGLILEDDTSVSRMAYRWLKVVHGAMRNRTDFAAATLHSENFIDYHRRPKNRMASITKDSIVMYKGLGTFGLSPDPRRWRAFQVGHEDEVIYKRNVSLLTNNATSLAPTGRKL